MVSSSVRSHICFGAGWVMENGVSVPSTLAVGRVVDVDVVDRGGHADVVREVGIIAEIERLLRRAAASAAAMHRKTIATVGG